MLALSKDRELRAQWQRAARAVVPIMSPEKANQVSFSPRKRPITSAQIRAAWALIRWRAQDLAREPAVGVATIRRAELAETETSMTAANNLAVQALEAAGVEPSATMAEDREYGCASVSSQNCPGMNRGLDGPNEGPGLQHRMGQSFKQNESEGGDHFDIGRR
jgi:hypothetical protein